MSPQSRNLYDLVFHPRKATDREPSTLMALADSLLDDDGADAAAHRLAAGLRFCVRHRYWPRRTEASVTYSPNHYILGRVEGNFEADAVLDLAGSGDHGYGSFSWNQARRFATEEAAVEHLGTVILALRYREG